ncbi:hypothetical protein [Poriferisphaera sp. WC338]|uniref:hypothetical protein n=1 Tax=Poriferisphaera sp. WC338 TaxID=3425129 RepID=UPI003D818717
MTSRVGYESLVGREAEYIGTQLRQKGSFVAAVWAIFALAMSLLPFIGILPGAVALLFNWNRHGWVRWTTFAAVGIQLLYILILIVGILLGW